MSSDLRYHIASLAAVFFALGIGILIGTAFVGAPLVSRQTALIKRLEGNVGELRRETRESETNEDALRILAPGVVRGKLGGRRVLVAQCGAYPDAGARAVDALRLAGASEIVEVALPASAWQRLDDAAGASSDQTETVEAEARRLAPLLLSGSDDALETYRRDGLLTGDTLDNKPVRLIVLVGGGQATRPTTANNAAPSDTSAYENLAGRLDASLATVWREAGAVVAGVEPVRAEASAMRIYQGAEIATVDCIDRAAGQIALPFALAGEKANYGVKSTADASRILPASLETDGSATTASPSAAPSPFVTPSPAPIAAASPKPRLSPSPQVSPSPSARRRVAPGSAP